jgi:hypothetical protein
MKNVCNITPIMRMRGGTLIQDRDKAIEQGFKPASSDISREEVVQEIQSAPRKLNLPALNPTSN